jgi:glutathione reductase (NADPH)
VNRYDIDLFVIGAGSGGVRAARIAAGYGANVMIAEADRVGGTCILRGCIPKKLMVLAGRYSDDLADARGFGWEIATSRHDWSRLIEAKDREIARLEGLQTEALIGAGVGIERARAIIVGPHRVRTDTGLAFQAKHIVIATGSRPMLNRDIPGVEHTITSDEMFGLQSLPERLAIVGGGYIGVEFAGLMHGLGSEVTLVHRGEHLLGGFDQDLCDALEAAYRRRGIKLKLGCTVSHIEHVAQGRQVRFSDETAAVFDAVMFATGRRPNIDGLGLEHVGVTVRHGAIAVDEYSTTNVPSIHAIGDVTNRSNHTPVAIREGHALADTLFGNLPTKISHHLVPTAVFSTPEIGCVGYTEEEARHRGADVAVFMNSFRPLKATLSGREESSLMKLIVDKADDRILGVHIFGEAASELIQLASVALTCQATKANFDATMAAHPTAAEELVTMREPVR